MKALAGACENHLADPIDVVGAGEDGDAAAAIEGRKRWRQKMT